MTGWLIYDKKQYEKNKWFAHELLKNCSAFCKTELIFAEKLVFGTDGNGTFFEYDEKAIPAPDFAVNRSIFPLLSLALEKSKVRVFNSYETAAFCNDKRKTYLAVSGCGVPVMKTAFFEKRFFDIESAKSFGFPCVLKSADGHGGKEVFPVQNTAELERCLGSFETGEFLLQKLCCGKSDLRVYVLGGKALGAVLRTPKSGMFKSNFSLGGKAERFEITEALFSAVRRVLDCLSFVPDFVGIDFLFDGESFVFNEIEDVVGTRMLYKTTDVDAAWEFSRYIKSEMESDAEV